MKYKNKLFGIIFIFLLFSVSGCASQNIIFKNNNVATYKKITKNSEILKSKKMYLDKIHLDANDNYGININTHCLTKREYELANAINEFRVSRGLPSVPISKSLSFIEKVHIFDALENPYSEKKCSAHSWSKQDNWTGCCAVVGQAKTYWCLFKKPKELLGFDNFGMTAENAAISRGEEGVILRIRPKDYLTGWLKSHGHRIVITNEEAWSGFEWHSLGVAEFNGRAYMIMGTGRDSEKIKLCSENNYAICNSIANKYLRNECLIEKVLSKTKYYDCDSIDSLFERKKCKENIYYNADICKQFNFNLAQQDDCFYQTAIRKKEVKHCENVRDNKKRQKCYSGVAVLTGDKEICNNLISKKSRDACFMETSVMLKDVSSCLKINNDRMRNSCYYKIALEKKNFSICQKISPVLKCDDLEPLVCDYYKNGGEITDCINAICNKLPITKRMKLSECSEKFLISQSDIEYCQNMNSEVGRDYCFMGKMNDFNNYLFCDYIKGKDIKDYCYNEAAQKARDPLICNFIEDQELKEGCKKYL